MVGSSIWKFSYAEISTLWIYLLSEVWNSDMKLMYELNQWQQKYIAMDKKSILLRWPLINFSFHILGVQRRQSSVIINK